MQPRGEERKKLVKKELIVALKGELYFVKFIINPKEDDFVPESFWEIIPETIAGIERLIIETIAYNDKYKKILDEIWKDKVGLDGKTVKEDEEAVKRIKGEALKEKEDPGAFIFPIRLEGKVNENALADTGSDINTMPYRIFETLGREDMKKVDRGITMIDHTQAEAMGKLSNVLCQVGVTTIIAKFLSLDIPFDRDYNSVARFDVLRTAESDSDDEEEYVIKRNKFGAPIYGPRPAPYLNCANLEDRSSAIQAEHTMEKSDRHDPNAQEMKPWKRYCFHKFTTSFYYGKDLPEMLSLAESEEEIFTSVAWIRAFNINEPIYAELCHEFYSTYEFDEYGPIRIFHQEKIIKFRLGDVLTLTCWSFARQIGNKDQADELERMVSLFTFEGVYVLKACVRGRRYDQGAEDDLWLFEYVEQAFKRICKCSLGDCKMDEEKRAGHRKRSNLLCDRAIEYRQSSTLGQSIMESLTYAGVYSVPPYGAYNPPGLRSTIAFDGEINLAFDENLISNEFTVTLCLDYEVKKEKKLVKKELIVALKGELYFVKFIINPEEDDFMPGVILGRSFLRLSRGIVDFSNGVITIYPEPDPFESDSEKTRKSSDDWD
ncbi:putative reverse transcriptase, RNA-dependent DNA polymerase [Tanacetum coccineum]